MKEQENIQVHETAFVTSAFRAYDENLSQDHYARLWLNPGTEKWIQEYLDQVSSEEIYTHCLRNRYFLEKIKDLIALKEIEVLINFGSGFSMYPFLLDKNVTHIEIDKPEIVNYKKEKIESWIRTNDVPQRNVHFVGVDFNENYQDDLLEKILSIKEDRPSFILIEGVLFFLNKKESDRLFRFFDMVQNPGDYIGSASFQDSLKDTAAYKNLIGYLNQRFSKASGSHYQTIPDNYYQTRKNYSLVDHQDYFSLAKKYGHTVQQDRELILNENFYLLKKG